MHGEMFKLWCKRVEIAEQEKSVCKCIGLKPRNAAKWSERGRLNDQTVRATPIPRVIISE